MVTKKNYFYIFRLFLFFFFRVLCFKLLPNKLKKITSFLNLFFQFSVKYSSQFVGEGISKRLIISKL